MPGLASRVLLSLILAWLITAQAVAQKPGGQNRSPSREATSSKHRALGSAKKQSRSSSSDSQVAARAELLQAFGANSVLSKAEIGIVAADPQKLEAIMQVIGAGQSVGGSEESIQNAKQKYLNNPTSAGLDDALFDIVADSQNVPKDSAREVGFKAADIVNLAAELQLLGDENPADRISNPGTWDKIKRKGREGFLADVLVESQDLPQAAKGLPLNELLTGIAKGQEQDADVRRAEYWQKIRGHLATGRDPSQDSKIDRQSPGNDHSKVRTPGQGQPGRAGASAGATGNHGASPLKGPGGVWVTMPHVVNKGANSSRNMPKNNSQGNSSGSSGTSKQHSPSHSSSSNFGSQVGTGNHLGGGMNTSSNSTLGQNQPSKPNASQGGAVNSHGPAAPAEQTGTGISAESGTPAGQSAVSTVIGVEQGDSGQLTYTWTRSGGSDGRDGIYETTYRKGADGTWSWEVSNAVTGEVVNQGNGVPPTTGIVGTSSQTTDDGSGMMYFPVEDDDPNEDGKTNPAAGGRGTGSTFPSTIDSPKDPNPAAGGRGQGSLFPGTIDTPKDPNPEAGSRGVGATMPKTVVRPVDTRPDLGVHHGPVTHDDLPPGGTRTKGQKGQGMWNAGGAIRQSSPSLSPTQSNLRQGFGSRTTTTRNSITNGVSTKKATITGQGSMRDRQVVTSAQPAKGSAMFNQGAELSTRPTQIGKTGTNSMKQRKQSASGFKGGMNRTTASKAGVSNRKTSSKPMSNKMGSKQMRRKK